MRKLAFPLAILLAHSSLSVSQSMDANSMNVTDIEFLTSIMEFLEQYKRNFLPQMARSPISSLSTSTSIIQSTRSVPITLTLPTPEPYIPRTSYGSLPPYQRNATFNLTLPSFGSSTSKVTQASANKPHKHFAAGFYIEKENSDLADDDCDEEPEEDDCDEDDGKKKFWFLPFSNKDSNYTERMSTVDATNMTPVHERVWLSSSSLVTSAEVGTHNLFTSSSLKLFNESTTNPNFMIVNDSTMRHSSPRYYQNTFSSFARSKALYKRMNYSWIPLSLAALVYLF
ncbi:uncharacterized protein RJT20DRAFT_130944 [Scheffersomyces xylosifermentans]|uniref:uncharacterized protein n=1 Tax=Scheffersomyces xylosifermentans TaxID=1304137 RepID=UPI00315CE84D